MPMEIPQRLPKILLVDDQPLNVQILYQAIGEFGEVYFADNADEAIAIFRRELPELLLIDIEMPGTNGFELLTELKSDLPAGYEFSAIFISSHQPEFYELPALLIGAVDFLQKPFNLLVAKARIHFHLKMRRRSNQLLQTQSHFIAMLNRLPISATLWTRDLINCYSNTLEHAWFRGQTESRRGQALSEFLGDAIFAQIRPELLQVVQGGDSLCQIQFNDNKDEPMQAKLRLLANSNLSGVTGGVFLILIELLPN